jgi:ribosome-binding factor A
MSKKTRRSGARPSRDPQFTLSLGDSEAEAMGHRQQRLERILHKELQTLLRDEAGDSELEGVVLIAVQLSPDAGHARIPYVVEASLSDEQRVSRSSRDALLRATGFLRARLAALLDLKRLPKLSFTFVGVREPGSHDSMEGGESWRD